MSTPAIEARGLVKTFGTTRALDGLDLRVETGEVHGFLGPNGAGKSTTIRALLGLLHLDAGELQVLGQNPWHDSVAIHRRLSYVPGDVSLWPNLSGGEVIDLLLHLRGEPTDHPSRAELLQRFELDPTKRGRSYSKGNRQKVALVAAFTGEPELLVLDEPTSGLDPLMEQVFNECIAEASTRGATVLLSSHILSEVERLADRVTIIRSGQTVETGTLADLRHLSRTQVQAVVRDSAAVARLEAIPGVHDPLVDGDRVSCSADPDALTAVAAALADAGLVSLQTAPPSLEDLFRDVYRQPVTPEVVP